MTPTSSSVSANRLSYRLLPLRFSSLGVSVTFLVQNEKDRARNWLTSDDKTRSKLDMTGNRRRCDFVVCCSPSFTRLERGLEAE